MPKESTPTRIPVEERLFSLVLALLASDHGLAKDEILSTVQGYRQSYTHSGDNSNLERMFERDKDGIRELGVPLETVEAADDPGNNQHLRYRIPRGAYELPPEIRFSSEEITLVNLAAMVWREGTLSAESRRALIKLRSLGIAADDPVIGYAPRVRVREAAFEPLNAALGKQVLVRFTYLKPGETTASVRSVGPLALVQHQGRWHLYAQEERSGLTRTFLLRRIVGSIAVTTTAFAAAEADHSGQAIRELEELWNDSVALVDVQPGTDAATRLNKRRASRSTTSGGLELHYTDINILADELAGFGPEVLVISPDELRDAVLERLRKAAADHG